MNVVVLAGGTGGTKLADGLHRVLPTGDLTVIVNTGDDVERHGLLVMPDHDAALYLLTGRLDEARGWGVVDESWRVIDALAAYGEDTWFRLGDLDLATHIARHARLAAGRTLTDAVLDLQRAYGLATAILPMTDEAVRTAVRTDDGWLPFQEYFVHRHQAPTVHEVRFDGIERARPTARVLAAIAAADAVVIGPSNPFVSIGPILAVPGLADAVRAARERGAAVVAVSPIVGGRALKGPADRMFRSLGGDPSAEGVARWFATTQPGLVDRLVIDVVDADERSAVADLGFAVETLDTVMVDPTGRSRFAGELLDTLAAATR